MPRDTWPRDVLSAETCAHWESAVRLYLGFGFTITHYRDSAFCRDAVFRTRPGALAVIAVC